MTIRVAQIVAFVFLTGLLAACSSSSSDGGNSSDADVQSSDLQVDWVDEDFVDEDLGDDSQTGDSTIDQAQPDVPEEINWEDVAAQQPAEVGQLVLSEFMAQSQSGADRGEWVEVYNGGDVPLDLKGCSLHDDGPDTHVVATEVRINPGEFAVLARSDNMADNHGLDPDYVYSGFTLNNMGDQIVITCGNTQVDRVDYDGTWITLGRSIQLSQDKLDSVLNDAPNNWCESEDIFGVKGKLGTPGLPNNTCPEVAPCEGNPCTNPPPASCQDEDNLVTWLSPGVCTDNNGVPECTYDQEIIDCTEDGQICEDGACVTPPNPCQPNPCDEPPLDYCDEDGITLYAYSEMGTCDVDDGQAKCSYTPETVDCSLESKTCDEGVCKFPGEGNTPAAGEVVVSEFMARSQSGADPGEWVELYNATDEYIDLGGCVLKDDDSDSFEFLPGTILPPMGYVVLARTADPDQNYGLDVDYEYSGFALSNSGDEVVVFCGEVIDRVAYDSTWVELAQSIQLDPDMLDATLNDARINWCLSDGLYGDETMRGSPGVENNQCPEPPTIQWCRLEAPLSADVFPLELVELVGRVGISTVTDQTTGIDSDPLLRAQGGYGPDNTTPDESTEWTWLTALGTDGWNGEDNDATGLDEYRTNVSVAASGLYDIAFRFSIDGGETWVYCDTNVGPGQDGSEDGYAPENAGQLTVQEPGLCMPNPCTEPPDAYCDEDGVTLHTFVTPGVCTEDGNGGYDCSYEQPIDISCSDTGEVCVGNMCVEEGAGVAPSASGDLIVTEFMARSMSGTDYGEWVELYNNSGAPLELQGCHLRDDGSDDFAITESLVVQPEDYVVIARSGEAAQNFGLVPDLVAGTELTLSNSEDEIVVECGTPLVEIDRVNYESSWVVLGAATQLDPDKYDPVMNDEPANWCQSTIGYGSADKLGTPGEENELCPEPGLEIAWCELTGDLNLELVVGDTLTAVGMVDVPGLTDITTGIDADEEFVAQLGVGSRDSYPMDNADWEWHDGAGLNPYDESIDGVVGADAYTASVEMLVGGLYDFSYRFSVDGGANWVYCDGAPGSDDGYSADDAGKLIVDDPVDPCVPNPCIEPPDDTCYGNTAVAHEAVGQCSVVEDMPHCDWITNETPCGESEVCEAGVCTIEGQGDTPTADGQIIVTEFMARSVGGSGDNGEWLELHNTTDLTLDLYGCSIADDGSNFHTIVASLPVAPGGYVVLAKSLDLVENWGLTADYAFGSDFTLGNSGDEIILQCGDPSVVIDRIDYTSSAVVLSTSWQISVDAYTQDNNDMSFWCPGSAEYGTDGRLGTPGSDNEVCAE